MASAVLYALPYVKKLLGPAFTKRATAFDFVNEVGVFNALLVPLVCFFFINFT